MRLRLPARHLGQDRVPRRRRRRLRDDRVDPGDGQRGGHGVRAALDERHEGGAAGQGGELVGHQRPPEPLVVPGHDDQPEAVEAGDEPAAVLAKDGVRRLYQVLDRLPPASRIAFALYEIDGRSMAEVAEVTGASVTATKLRVWRARRTLEAAAARDPEQREFLADDGGAR